VKDLRDAPDSWEDRADRFYLGWPILKGAVTGGFDYVGPYFTACDHGCAHSRDHPHGYGGLHGLMGTPTCFSFPMSEEQVRDLCFRAIDRSEIVFAWIDEEECYGTMLELGYAAKAGKFLFVAWPSDFCIDDFWLSVSLANVTGSFESPAAALWFLRGHLNSRSL